MPAGGGSASISPARRESACAQPGAGRSDRRRSAPRRSTGRRRARETANRPAREAGANQAGTWRQLLSLTGFTGASQAHHLLKPPAEGAVAAARVDVGDHLVDGGFAPDDHHHAARAGDGGIKQVARQQHRRAAHGGHHHDGEFAAPGSCARRCSRPIPDRPRPRPRIRPRARRQTARSSRAPAGRWRR